MTLEQMFRAWFDREFGRLDSLVALLEEEDDMKEEDMRGRGF